MGVLVRVCMCVCARLLGAHIYAARNGILIDFEFLLSKSYASRWHFPMQSMTPPDVQRRSRIIPYHYHNYPTTSLTTSKFCLVVSNKRTELKTKLILTSNIRCRVGYLPSDEFYLRIQNSIYKYTHTQSNEWMNPGSARHRHSQDVHHYREQMRFIFERSMCRRNAQKLKQRRPKHSLPLHSSPPLCSLFFSVRGQLKFISNWDITKFTLI